MKCTSEKVFSTSACGIIITALVVIVGECQPLPLSAMMFHEFLFLAEGESPEFDNSIEPAIPPGGAGSLSTSCQNGFLYHKETSKCYEILTQGPCGELQHFYPTSRDSPYGECACQSNPDGCSRLVPNNRLILPGSDNKRCFWGHSQGPCKSPKEWYVLSAKTFKPECQPNPCLSESEKDQQDPNSNKNTTVLTKLVREETDLFTFVRKGVCFQTFTQAFCPQDQYVQFLGTNDPNPRCFKIKSGLPMCLLGVAPVVGMPCDPGYKLVGDECTMVNIEFE